MIPYLAIFLSSFAITFSGAVMPGPLLTTTITESLRRGFTAGPLLIAGHGLLELALLIGLLLGVSPLLTRLWFFVSVSLAGGLILLGMAWSMWRAMPALKPLEADEGNINGRNLIVKGAAISLANPYFTIWWATIGIGYIMHSLRFGTAGVVAFFSGHILADLLWYGAVSFALAKGKMFLTPGLYRMLMGAGAALLALFACWFIYAGLSSVVSR